MTSSPIRRFGLIGAGAAGQAYMRALSGLNDSRLVAIVEPEDQLLNQTLSYLKTLPGSVAPGIFTDWQDMLQSTPLDALIMTRADPSGKDVVAALGNPALGLLMPVPQSKGLGQSPSVLKQIRKRKAPVQLGLTARRLEVVMDLLSRVESGAIGTVRRVDVHLILPQQDNQDGDGMRALADALDVAGVAIGDPPALLSASASPKSWRKTSPGGLPDSLLLTIEGRKSAHALIALTRRRDQATPSLLIDVTGSEGNLECKASLQASGAEGVPPADGEHVLIRQLDAFRAALGASGSRKPDHDEVLRVLTLLDAVDHALAKSGPVKLKTGR